MPIRAGNILYVGGTGDGNYTNIQDAIENASDGDTVFVYNGTYYEHLFIDKSISLIGENKNTTVIDGDKNNVDIVRVTANWVNIRGFTIQNGGHHQYGVGIQILSKHTIITDNNIISNIMYGIHLKHSYGSIITGNNITNNDKGIYLEYSTGNTIIDNIISKNWGGIRLEYSTGNTIIDNIISKNYAGGIGIWYSSNENTVTGNNILKSRGGIGFGYSNSNNIIDNIISEHEDNGINLYHSSGNNITSNTISYNYFGIHLDNSIGNNITGNTISINSGGGIYFYRYSGNSLIKGNKIVFNPIWGIYIQNSNENSITGNKIMLNFIGLFLGNSSSNIIERNNFLLNLKNALFFFNTVDNNEWRQNYWNRPRVLPKLIRGNKYIDLYNTIPWFNIDWRPALKPYDIEI
jgi:parallel beta-helix repeat protein